MVIRFVLSGGNMASKLSGFILLLFSWLFFQFRVVRCTLNGNNSSLPTSALIESDVSMDAKIIYFNNPHLLTDRRPGEEKLREDGKLYGGSATNSPGEERGLGGVSIRDEALIMGLQLRDIANEELAITTMQSIFDSSPFITSTRNEDEFLDEVSIRLGVKMKKYLEALRVVKNKVEEVYWLHSWNPVTVGEPCCLFGEKWLKYNEQFGGKVSLDHSCDLTVIQTNDLHHFNPSQNLTQVFEENLQQNPNIKWQYLMTQEGLHIEYPAHKTDGRINCHVDEIHQRSWVHEAYIWTLNPLPKSVMIVLDHGNSLSQRQMLLGKSVATSILWSLSQLDEVGLIVLSNESRLPRVDSCHVQKMVPASNEVKSHLSRYLDGIIKSNYSTNHSLGFTKAFQVIRATNKSSNQDVMLVYISRGLLSSLTDARVVLSTIDQERIRTRPQVVVNTFVLIDEHKPVMYEKGFLKDVADQNFEKYGIPTPRRSVHKGVSMEIHSITDANLVPRKLFIAKNLSQSSSPHFTLPVRTHLGLTISLTLPCIARNGEPIGIVGLDVHVADIIEDIGQTTRGTYAFLVDKLGYVIAHPAFGHAMTSSGDQPAHTDIAHVENKPGFKLIRKDILTAAKGRETLGLPKKDSNRQDGIREHGTVTYTWKKVPNTPYVICFVNEGHSSSLQSLKMMTLPPGADVVYHRLDLLTSVSTCQHLRHLSTVDAGSIFLSASTFLSPFDYLSQEESKRSVQSYMAYLNDGTKLLANPGLKSSIRSDVVAISRITSHWRERFFKSDLSKYIVRRYIATPSGVFLVHPGSILDRKYDPLQRSWYMDALEYPGQIVVTAPYLDVGGGGFIVTVSHTIFEGKPAALHGPKDAISAVMGVDFTLGYFYKFLLENIPMCTYERIACFLMDHRGYLIAHPGLMEPNGKGPLEQQHITHKEPLVAHDILNHIGFVKKRACNNFGDRTVQRFYSFNSSIDHVLTNLVHGEHCSKYFVAPIPGTNVFLGMVNQTCDVFTAFCPCSMVDRLCLNCHRMEQSECECPCECSLEVDMCSGQPVDATPSCPHFPQEMRFIDLEPSDSLNPCFDPNCGLRQSESHCFGVVGCEWCQLDIDGVTPLKQPFCTEQRRCFGGVFGSRTPYADEIVDLPLEDFMTVKSTPVGPVAGGIMAGFLVLALGVYCYRHHVTRSSHLYVSTVRDTAIRMSHLDEGEDENHEEFLTGGHCNVVVASLENPGIHESPYRVVNPGHGWRPPGSSDSDHGYSTMTPHEGSEYLAYSEPNVQLHRERLSRNSSLVEPPPLRNGSRATAPLLVDLEQTVVPDVRRNILAPVQVHMVD